MNRWKILNQNDNPQINNEKDTQLKMFNWTTEYQIIKLNGEWTNEQMDTLTNCGANEFTDHKRECSERAENT